MVTFIINGYEGSRACASPGGPALFINHHTAGIFLSAVATKAVVPGIARSSTITKHGTATGCYKQMTEQSGSFEIGSTVTDLKFSFRPSGTGSFSALRRLNILPYVVIRSSHLHCRQVDEYCLPSSHQLLLQHPFTLSFNFWDLEVSLCPYCNYFTAERSSTSKPACFGHWHLPMYVVATRQNHDDPPAL